MFKNVVAVVGNKPALSVKKNKKWVSISYAEYLRQCEVFAKALMALKVNQGKSVNIIGFNSPEWAISFYGSIFGNYLPVGIYTTNNSDACHYVADHSDCEVAVVENVAQLN